MTDFLAGLTEEFRDRVTVALQKCRDAGLVMTPCFGIRSPMMQGLLWRQSRTSSQVATQVKALNNTGAPFLASCIVQAGPHDGPWATNALPGQSWHQYGEALDCFATNPDGSADWNTPAKYSKFGMICEANGLRWGGHFGDYDHVQLRVQEVPEIYRSLSVIDAQMQKQWSK